ncbi:mismatch repair endonuclease PMS2 [Adelges cooleyi]|uniref:mismatch repair endonuclease PMS2 n=1 Tax=Adelges cooleyi TaxID=133065 RepID=UPI0021802089|nr:mismatch repair endonuclease PMS2 [Adelges cooleyi]XP_050425417.1 mismatch repair endonuclease PMS2 [Adelges cooleyi]
MSGQIKPISKLDIHKICSGQVVLNLATAVKELIENSLDAGATFVELKIKEYGKDMIEVTDNGCGVHPDNFEGLALKHHTSKIQEFSDLSSIETFGFRGEALSSLCALSDVIVTTRHTSQPCGTKLVFDYRGHIKIKVPCARQVGTAVTLTNLFSTLPVRYKEFHRNLKKEFGKMIQVVTGYCLVATQVKILCSNQTKSNNNIILSTHGGNTVLENISCIFGSKQASNLLEFKKVNPEEIGEQEENIFEIDGYVSSCDHNSGRSSKDRQFYFINSRPCEPSKIIKTVNEVYHQYNQNQYPFVYLNINIKRAEVDVNVTPDKRQIFLTNENSIISILKMSLTRLYETIPSTYKINTSIYESFSLKRSHDETILENSIIKQPKLATNSNLNQQENSSSHVDQIKAKLSRWKSEKSKVVTTNRIDTFLQKKHEVNDEVDIEDKNENQESKVDFCVKKCNFMQDNTEGNKTTEFEKKHFVIEKTDYKQFETKNFNLQSFSTLTHNLVEDREKSFQTVKYKSDHSGSTDEMNISSVGEADVDIVDSSSSNTPHKCIEIDKSSATASRREVVVRITIDEIEQRLKNLWSKEVKKRKAKTRFYAAIDPNKNKQAENELSKEITKTMFSQMSIIGQFNLGFIITKLDADLFIVDQHATDEKYNFETLQKTTKITSQKLVVPQQLELTAVNEMILIENIDIFRMNGFDFEIQESEVTTKKVKMTMIPMSKNWKFGKEDVDELLFMLQDSPHTLCRPSRVRSMFASRACRKSVMIGTVLNKNDMRKLINNMGVIEQPWNCPHGRPTMRHLVNLVLLEQKLE